jgi:hypothetical protein
LTPVLLAASGASSTFLARPGEAGPDRELECSGRFVDLELLESARENLSELIRLILHQGTTLDVLTYVQGQTRIRVQLDCLKARVPHRRQA